MTKQFFHREILQLIYSCVPINIDCDSFESSNNLDNNQQ